MPDHSQTLIETHGGNEKRSKFPVLHFIFGLILSLVSFVVLVCIEAFIVNGFDSYSRDYTTFDFLPPVLRAYLIPELLMISTLIWLASKSYSAGKSGYMRSYVILTLINIICFMLICMVMGSVQC
jgi:hypothetical protein